MSYEEVYLHMVRNPQGNADYYDELCKECAEKKIAELKKNRGDEI